MKNLLKDKKAQLQSVIVSLVIIGIVLGIGFLVLEEFSSKTVAGSESKLAVNDTIVALGELPDWLDIIVIIAIVGILLALVFAIMPSGIGVNTNSADTSA